MPETLPIKLPIKTNRISQAEFDKSAYRVMENAFAIHNQFRRLFDEKIYQHELADRLDHFLAEVPVTVSHRTFSKTFSIDLFEIPGGIFERKVSDKIHPRHRAQLTSYLLMTDLAHGKIINFRPTQVEHEFVNCETRLADQRSPKFVYANWKSGIAFVDNFEKLIRELVADWGIGLGIDTYKEAVDYLLGQASPVSISGSKSELGKQSLSLISPTIGFKITGLTTGLDEFRNHAQRFLQRTQLECLIWANLSFDEVRLEID